MNAKEMAERMQLVGEKVGEKVNNYQTIKDVCKDICADLMAAIREGVDFRACYPYAYSNLVNISEIGYMAGKNCIWGDGYMISDFLVDARSFVHIRNQERTKGRAEALAQIRAELGGVKLYYRDGCKFTKYDI